MILFRKSQIKNEFVTRPHHIQVHPGRPWHEERENLSCQRAFTHRCVLSLSNRHLSNLLLSLCSIKKHNFYGSSASASLIMPHICFPDIATPDLLVQTANQRSFQNSQSIQQCNWQCHSESYIRICPKTCQKRLISKAQCNISNLAATHKFLIDIFDVIVKIW